MKRIAFFIILAALLSIGTAAQKEKPADKGAGKMDTITVESSAFGNMQPIPRQYTCDGADISPPLSWRGVPPAAKSIVCIADDPDAPAGTWVHWVVYDLPASDTVLIENIPKADTAPGGGKQGTNDFRRIGWGGPCPPGGTHRYFFKLYALDTMLNLPAGKTKKDVEKAMAGHILAKGELIGTYTRKR